VKGLQSHENRWCNNWLSVIWTNQYYIDCFVSIVISTHAHITDYKAWGLRFQEVSAKFDLVWKFRASFVVPTANLWALRINRKSDFPVSMNNTVNHSAMELQNSDLFVTMDDYAMQDDERDLDFSPGQKRSRKNARKSSPAASTGDPASLSSSLPNSGMGLGGHKDVKVRLERSRQSARECRARKKLRYQYLEELVTHREKAVVALREEVGKYIAMYRELDKGNYPPEMDQLAKEFQQPQTSQHA